MAQLKQQNHVESIQSDPEEDQKDKRSGTHT